MSESHARSKPAVVCLEMVRPTRGHLSLLNEVSGRLKTTKTTWDNRRSYEGVSGGGKEGRKCMSFAHVG